jgi:hypothetical protein
MSPRENTEPGAPAIVFPGMRRHFASAIVRLLGSLEQAKVVGEKGRTYVAEHLTYNVIADSVEREILRQTVDFPKRGDPRVRSQQQVQQCGSQISAEQM